ncbi:hypothetical protein ACFQ2T_06400 [Methylophilus flavus]|jgi:hypothetical protein|uniref:Uncharacterized protein n=1 Tax=Methylophilus flavus TaxID=640084 RepID=A0ABW3PB18_9PROT
MRKFLLLLALSAIARKVVAAVKNNQPTANAGSDETLHPSTH